MDALYPFADVLCERVVHLPDWGIVIFAARRDLGGTPGWSLHQIPFYFVRISDRQSLGTALASVHCDADQWSADGASRAGCRGFARALFRRLDEVGSVATNAPAECTDCVVLGGEKTNGSIMVSSRTLYDCLFCCDGTRPRRDRGRVRSCRLVAQFSLLQF